MKSLAACVAIFAILFATSCTQSSQKLLARANQYHHEKKYKEASILYRKALINDKKNAEAYYREGLNQLDQGNVSEASKFLRRAVDLKPDNSDAEIKLAEIYLFAYRHDPKKFTTLLPEIHELIAKILHNNPNSFDGIRLQGISYLAEKNTDKALESFTNANRIKPYSRQLVGWYAETLVAAKRPDEAGALVRDMIAHDKAWEPGYDFLFLQYKQENNPEKAEAVLRERVQIDPSNPTAIVNLANYLATTNRFGDAEALMQRVVAKKETFPAGREMLGDFYLRSRRFDQALEQYRAGAREDQKNALRYDQRVVATYSLMGRRDDALRLAETLAEKNPKDRPAARIYASLLLETGQKSDAIKAQTELNSLIQRIRLMPLCMRILPALI